MVERLLPFRKAPTAVDAEASARADGGRVSRFALEDEAKRQETPASRSPRVLLGALRPPNKTAGLVDADDGAGERHEGFAHAP